MWLYHSLHPSCVTVCNMTMCAQVHHIKQTNDCPDELFNASFFVNQAVDDSYDLICRQCSLFGARDATFRIISKSAVRKLFKFAVPLKLNLQPEGQKTSTFSYKHRLHCGCHHQSYSGYESYTYIHIYMYICIYKCVCVCIYIYINIKFHRGKSCQHQLSTAMA